MQEKNKIKIHLFYKHITNKYIFLFYYIIKKIKNLIKKTKK